MKSFWKNNELDGCDIEVQIENPFEVEIEGKKGDFTVGHYATKDIDMSLSFVFYPTILQTPNQNNLSNSMMNGGLFGTQQRKILSPLHSTGATATPNLPNLTKIISPENTPKTSPSPQSISTTAKSTTPLTPTPAPASKPQKLSTSFTKDARRREKITKTL
uniref:Uncharacterized protein n=1 Tax=Panagrolaimus superbus TaxID=310955 RepID=A0A914YAN4_9BILA